MTRYGRHLSLPGFGADGQERLRAASVAIVGVGGLGNPAALYLAAAGTGTIGLIDNDVVDLTNLQRQVLYTEDDIGELKVDIAERRLAALNRDVSIRTHALRLTAENALDVLGGYDIVLDGTDNFATRYLVNDATVLLGIPNVHGSVLRYEGRVAVFGTASGPCYRCLFPDPPPPGVVPDCSDAGVLGVMPGMIGVLQATEVIKHICGLGESLSRRMLIVDSLGMRFQSIAIERDPSCPACGTREIRHLIDYDAFCAGGRRPANVESITPRALAGRLATCSQVVDVREPWEWNICRLPGARLAPLGQLDAIIGDLDPAAETIVYCHRGVRSLEGARRLMAAGFVNVTHLEGGIDRWSSEVDANVARY
jgi:adenylyltransferase/sulfurtransferase